MAAALTEPAFWVLTALAEAPAHGYVILRRVEEVSGGDGALRVTTLYATLERLERSHLVRVLSEQVVDGRARRTYEITDDGRSALSTETERLLARAAAARRGLQGGVPAVPPAVRAVTP